MKVIIQYMSSHKDEKDMLLLLLCTVMSLMMTTIDPIRNVKLLSVNIK